VTTDTEAEALQETLEIVMARAITYQGGTYDRIELQEPNAGQVKLAEREMKPGTMEAVRSYQIKLVSLVSGKPTQVIEQLPVSKLMEAVRFLEGFILTGPGTSTP
jgi:hypothetical protein